MNPETNKEQIKYCPNCGMRMGEASKVCCIHCGYAIENVTPIPVTNPDQKKQMNVKSESKVIGILFLIANLINILTLFLPMTLAGIAMMGYSAALVKDGTITAFYYFESIMLMGGYSAASIAGIITAFKKIKDSTTSLWSCILKMIIGFWIGVAFMGMLGAYNIMMI